MGLFIRKTLVQLNLFLISPPLHPSSCWMANCKRLYKPTALPCDYNLSTKTPTTNPHPYPITTTFQPNSNGYSKPCFASKFEVGVGGSSELAHLLDNGLPHNSTFP